MLFLAEIASTKNKEVRWRLNLVRTSPTIPRTKQPNGMIDSTRGFSFKHALAWELSGMKVPDQGRYERRYQPGKQCQ